MSTQENIRNLREEHNLSQDDMAEKLGMSVNGYGKIERGQSDLSLKRLQQIAEVFDIDVSEIVKSTDKEMALVIGENHGVMQNNYHADSTEIEKLTLIIQHQQEKINDLKDIVSQKDEYIKLLKKLSNVEPMTLEKL